MNRYEHWLRVGLDAAEEAAAYARHEWRAKHVIHEKGYRDIVTDTDLAMEALILDRLHAAFPDHAVTSEEAGVEASDAHVRWLIDPLDGTSNFSRNNPNFSTAIAAIEDGVPVIGIIYDALRAQAFTAYAGGGAYLDGEAIHVSGQTEVAEAIVSLDAPREPHLRQQMLTYIERFLARGRTIRALGSAALNMAYVATGWVDGYFSAHMKPWDQTAAVLLVREAGGAVGTVSGKAWTPYSPDPLLAATPTLLEAIRLIIGGESP
ncbi:MAG: inositol monophosphatase family protein [Anaerolineae bacterium]